MKNTNYSVKKHLTYVVLLLALMCSGAANARVDHYIGGYLQAGEWTLLPLKSQYGPSIGGAGGLGFQYELMAGNTYSPLRFLADVGFGANGGWTSFMQGAGVDTVPMLLPQTDLQGRSFKYVYEVCDRHDQYMNVAVQVPLMIGMQYRRFYVLAGVKIYANILTLNQSNARINTYGQYNDIVGETGIGDLRNLPDLQFFTNESKSSSDRSGMSVDVNGTIEIGGRLGPYVEAVGFDVPKTKFECRLAAFADFGITNFRERGTRALSLETPQLYDTNMESDNYVYGGRNLIEDVNMYDLMSTSGFAEAVKNAMIGIKLTMLFELPQPGTCVICRDAYRSSARLGRSGRGVKYEE